MRLASSGPLPNLQGPVLDSMRRLRRRIADHTSRIEADDSWAAPTTCPAWNRQQLLQHLRWGHEAIAGAFEGRNIVEPGTTFDPVAAPMAYVEAHTRESTERTDASLLDAVDTTIGLLEQLGDGARDAMATWGAPVDIRLLTSHLVWDNVCHEIDLWGDEGPIDTEDMAFAATYATMMGTLGVAMRGIDAERSFVMSDPATAVNVEVRSGVVSVVAEPSAESGTVEASLVLGSITGRRPTQPSNALGLDEPFASAADGFRYRLTGGL